MRERKGGMQAPGMIMALRARGRTWQWRNWGEGTGGNWGEGTGGSALGGRPCKRDGKLWG